MKRQLAKAVEIGVETVNYWIISYALSSMAMIFRAEWIFVLFFASNVSIPTKIAHLDRSN